MNVSSYIFETQGNNNNTFKNENKNSKIVNTKIPFPLQYT